MEALSLQLAGGSTVPPVISGAPYDVPQPRLEAPPFEGKLQRDAFVNVEVDGDAALRSFIERARSISTARGDSLMLPPMPSDPRMSSPMG